MNLDAIYKNVYVFKPILIKTHDEKEVERCEDSCCDIELKLDFIL